MSVPPISGSSGIHASSGLPAPSDFHAFTAKICDYLDAKNYTELNTYFQANHNLYRTTLQQQKTLDCLLEEMLLEKFPNNDDSFRALQLATMMEKYDYNPSWAKICQAMCHFQFGNLAYVNMLIQQMVNADQLESKSKSFKCQLEDYEKIYTSTGNNVMLERIRNLLSHYLESAIQAVKSLSGAIKV